MMKDYLKDTFLFSGLNDEELDDILTKVQPRTVVFKRGEIVYPNKQEGYDVGFILDGRCEIRRPRSDGGKTVLNILEYGDSFGILSVFSAEDFPTQVFASKNSTILFFSSEQINEFVNNYSRISSNIIKFLASRVSFLNKKIATFSGNTVESRLSAFLLSEYEMHECDHFPFNVQKTSEEINAGRASVYRAIDTLQAEGLITLCDKKIYIKDLTGLERITK